MSIKQVRSWAAKSLFLSLFLAVVSLGTYSPLRAQAPRFAYVANNGSANVSAYTIDATTGALTPIPGSPFDAGTSPASVAIVGP